MTKFQPLRINEVDETLRIEWSNRDVPKDGCVFVFFVLFWIVWCPLTLAVTWLAFERREAFFFIWLVFGWVGTLGVPYTLLRRYWSEVIEVSSRAVTHRCVGLLAPRPKVWRLELGLEIFLGFYDEESNCTLSLIRSQNGSTKRHLLAYWLSPKLKGAAFDAIKRFVEAKHIDLTMREAPAKATRR